MVIMDNYYLQERLSQLWNRIDKLHLKYLDVEESPEKIDIRNKLEDLIREYLCMASHDQKFSLSVTYEILYASANVKHDFSAYKAATGFNALQLYAGNLVSQPWRKEYKQIRKYSGFYKHQVESNLASADLLLQAMGYKSVGSSTLILDGPIGPDKVITASKDCLIAYVECQIVKAIWEEITSSNITISWIDILEFRQKHLCSPEQSIEALKYQYQQRHFQEHRSNSQGNLNLHHTLSGYSNHSFPPVISREHVQTSMLPQYLYGTTANGCCQNACMAYAQMDSHRLPPPLSYPPCPNMIKPQFNANGYYYANGLTPQLPNYNNSTIPIGQLIEVDSHNDYDVVDRGTSHSRNAPRGQNMGEMYANYTPDDLMGRENREANKSGTPPFENWDYVYKTLENQGYNKDLGERGDVLCLETNGKIKNDPKSVEKKKKEFKKPKEVSTNNLSISSKTKQLLPDKMTKSRKLSDTKSEQDVSPASSYDNLSPNDKKQPGKNSIATISKTKSTTPGKSSSSKQPPKSSKKEEKGKTKPEGSPWHCKACTYLNNNSKNICEMCSKTRSNVDDEVEVGGAECEQCTLVNPKDAKTCQACDQSLKNSPTRV